MAMISWPSSLPQQLLTDGFEEQPPDLTVRTEPDEGPDKLRRWGTGNIRPVQGQQLMNGTQVQDLDDFYLTTTKAGTLRFNWDDPRGGSSVEMRFTERPTYAALGGDLYRVQLRLEIMP